MGTGTSTGTGTDTGASAGTSAGSVRLTVQRMVLPDVRVVKESKRPPDLLGRWVVVPAFLLIMCGLPFVGAGDSTPWGGAVSATQGVVGGSGGGSDGGGDGSRSSYNHATNLFWMNGRMTLFWLNLPLTVVYAGFAAVYFYRRQCGGRRRATASRAATVGESRGSCSNRNG